jgi:transaldolase
MYDFFFDSADVDFVKSTWAQIKHVTTAKHVRGITTNPKAMYRVDCHSLTEWKNKALELCELVSEIRRDNKGVVYVQLPNCDASQEDALSFAKEISTWGDGQTKIAMKIPPYKPILEIVDKLERFVETNVTGVADCGTALFAASYNVRYVSIIPGRMEEVGIDSDAHLKQTTDANLGRTEIIAGSMRTIDGLKRSVMLGTVPTIGGTVFGLVLKDLSAMQFEPVNHSNEKPTTSKENIGLSSSFFVEMNGLGETAAKEFGI